MCRFAGRLFGHLAIWYLVFLMFTWHTWTYRDGQRPRDFGLAELPPLITGSLERLEVEARKLPEGATARLNIEHGKDGVDLDATRSFGTGLDRVRIALERINRARPDLWLVVYGLVAADWWGLTSTEWTPLERRNAAVARALAGLVHGVGVDLYLRQASNRPAGELAVHYDGVNQAEAVTVAARAGAAQAVRDALRLWPGAKLEGWTSSRLPGNGAQVDAERATAHFDHLRKLRALGLSALIVLEGWSDADCATVWNATDARLARWWVGK
jgi:hypothetical protein